MNSNRNTINFMGVNIDVVATEELYSRIVECAVDSKTHKVMYVNADCILIAQKDAAYRKILNRADLVYADGMSIVWGARLLGKYLPGRSTAADFMMQFCREFAEKGLGIYLLGARPGVVEAAGVKLKQAIPELKIVGTRHGYFQHEENEKIIDQINRATPHILLIGLGAPYQEKWIDRNFNRINVPVIWGVGGLFDFLSGRLKRGPQFLLDNGFEWFCRLCVEPSRLWKRYLIGNLLFMWYVLRWKFSRKDGNKIASEDS